MPISTVGIIAAQRQVGGGGGGITATFQAESLDAANLTTYTFTAQPIGTAAANRRVVVAASARAASGSITISSVTIGGVTASRDAFNSAPSVAAEIWSAVVPTGTTANVVITGSSGASGMGLGVWTIDGGSSAPTGQVATSPNNTANMTMSLTTTVGDICIGVSSYRSSLTGPRAAWNVASERYDGDYDTAIRKHTGADFIAIGASVDMGVVISNFSTDSTACAAAYA